LLKNKEIVEVYKMNFGDIGSMGGAVARFIATSEGQDAIRKFLALPDGITMLQSFAGIPEGQKVILSILPQILGGLNLPPGVGDSIKGAIGTQQ
jgi:hypothetical protein